jgi:hypothetical protein
MNGLLKGMGASLSMIACSIGEIPTAVGRERYAPETGYATLRRHEGVPRSNDQVTPKTFTIQFIRSGFS